MWGVIPALWFRWCVSSATLCGAVVVNAAALPPIAPIVYRAFDAAAKDSRIYVKHPTDPTPELVYHEAGIVQHVKWSPDGRDILFDLIPLRGPLVNDNALYVMRANGANISRLTLPLGLDAQIQGHTWGPGRGQVTYVTRDGGAGAAWVVDLADLGAPHKIMSPGGTFHRPPAWSPDRSRIAYGWAPFEGGAIDLWVADADGANATRLTRQAVGTTPSWSPDGASIVSVSNRELTIIDLANPNERLRLPDNDARERGAVWLPDGRWIVYLVNRNIHLVTADGKEHHSLDLDVEPHAPGAFDWYDPTRPVRGLGKSLQQWGAIKASE